MLKKMFFDIDENGMVLGYGTSAMNETCIEIDVEEDHDVFTNVRSYKINEQNELVFDDILILEIAIEQKDKELNLACSKAIMGKFPVVVNGITYYFSNDMEAQINFDKMLRAFESGKVSLLPWTVYTESGEVERIILDPIIFETIYDAHLNHIQGNISRYRDVLMPMVKNSTTLEGIDVIFWEMVV